MLLHVGSASFSATLKCIHIHGSWKVTHKINTILLGHLKYILVLPIALPKAALYSPKVLAFNLLQDVKRLVIREEQVYVVLFIFDN